MHDAMTGGTSPEPVAAVHITPYGRAWAVRRSDDAAPLSQVVHRADAVDLGQRIATALGAQLVLFDAHWRVVDARWPA